MEGGSSASPSAWGRNPLLPVGAEELQHGMARIPQGLLGVLPA